MSAHAVDLEVRLHVETDRCVSPYQSGEFAWYYHGLRSALWIFLYSFEGGLRGITDRRKQNGGKMSTV